MLKRLDLDLDLQTKFKATRQKMETGRTYRKIPSTTIIKGKKDFS